MYNPNDKRVFLYIALVAFLLTGSSIAYTHFNSSKQIKNGDSGGVFNMLTHTIIEK